MNDTRRRAGRSPDEFAAAFEVAFARARDAVLAACSRDGPWQVRVAAAVHAAVGFAAEDRRVARTLTLEALVVQPGGGRRYLRLVDCFSELLAAEAPRDRSRPYDGAGASALRASALAARGPR